MVDSSSMSTFERYFFLLCSSFIFILIFVKFNNYLLFGIIIFTHIYSTFAKLFGNCSFLSYFMLTALYNENLSLFPENYQCIVHSTFSNILVAANAITV